ncbi:type II toxin-antitoxin system YafQ family toxin [Parabacteroides sp. ZJ-118]|uniref:type II toxin-antitoxin system RelE/ParE family toxin n=1 Tax=Parabacteroides sp. ZJ-118 TaxID=2709398 RepID=UPI0013EDA42F|nr:type II toxin-antitoxin system YafQ family toxin [Parabacteroides sp. ZJ-118]
MDNVQGFHANRFKKAFKRCIKRGLDIGAFDTVIDILIEKGSLPPVYRSHKLSSKFNFAWECHIEPDWLLVWEQDDDTLTSLLAEKKEERLGKAERYLFLCSVIPKK